MALRLDLDDLDQIAAAHAPHLVGGLMPGAPYGAASRPVIPAARTVPVAPPDLDAIASVHAPHLAAPPLIQPDFGAGPLPTGEPRQPTPAESKAAGPAAFRAGMPTVTDQPGTPGYYRERIQQEEYKKQHPWGSPVSEHPGFLGKVAHGLATAGNIAGDIFAPATMALIPGTQLNRNMREAGLENELGKAQTGQSEEELRGAQTEEAKARAGEAEARTRQLEQPDNPADKKIDEYVNNEGHRVLIFQKPNGESYEKAFGTAQGKAQPGGPHTTDFGGFHWQYDPEGKLPGERQGDWVRLGPSNRQGRESSGELTPAQRLAQQKARNQAEREKGEGLRRAEDDIRRRYGLTGFAANEPWPKEAIDELTEEKQRIQDEYETKLGNLGADVTHFDYSSQRGRTGESQNTAGGNGTTLDRQNPEHRRIAAEILQEAGGDVKKARQIAKQRGYKF